MLVLSRKVGEKLIIGENVTVEVLRIAGNRITLGIVAPSDVKILRSELNRLPIEPCKSQSEGQQDPQMVLLQAS